MLPRVALVSALLLLVLVLMLARHARRRGRRPGPFMWLSAIFAIAVILFVVVNAFVGSSA